MSELSRPDFDAIQLPAGKTPFLHLCWLLHNKCNHKCSYCAEINWGGNFENLSLEACKNFVQQARDHFHDRKLMVSFTGGEPTLWPNFGELVRWLKEDVNAVVMMTSNGTRHISYFKEIAKYFDWISFSYHPEFTRDEKFFENVIACSASTNLTVRVMFPPNPALFAKSKSFLDRLVQKQEQGEIPGFVKVESVPIAVGFGTEFTSPAKYNDEQDKVLFNSIREFNTEKLAVEAMPISQLRAYRTDHPDQENWFEPNELIAREKTNFYGWKCDIGIEQLFIDHLGQVVRAGCRVGGEIGYLSKGVFRFPTKAVYCPKQYCHCITDILTTKRSPEWLAKIENESMSIGDRAVTYLNSIRYDWMTQITRIEREGTNDISDMTLSATGKLMNFAPMVLYRTWYFILRVFIYTRVWTMRFLIRVFYARVFWKPYFFIRYQYRKRILKLDKPEA